MKLYIILFNYEYIFLYIIHTYPWRAPFRNGIPFTVSSDIHNCFYSLSSVIALSNLCVKHGWRTGMQTDGQLGIVCTFVKSVYIFKTKAKSYQMLSVLFSYKPTDDIHFHKTIWLSLPFHKLFLFLLTTWTFFHSFLNL